MLMPVLDSSLEVLMIIQMSPTLLKVSWSLLTINICTVSFKSEEAFLCSGSKNKRAWSATFQSKEAKSWQRMSLQDIWTIWSKITAELWWLTWLERVNLKKINYFKLSQANFNLHLIQTSSTNGLTSMARLTVIIFIKSISWCKTYKMSKANSDSSLRKGLANKKWLSYKQVCSEPIALIAWIERTLLKQRSRLDQLKKY